MDYTYQYKEVLTLDGLNDHFWSLFISAFSPAERVCAIYERVRADQKDWLIHHEYQFRADEIPDGSFQTGVRREDEYIVEYIESRLAGIDLTMKSICVDVTGFMRPHMLYLVHYLNAKGVKRFDVIYTEPGRYERRDATKFASELVHTVRQVAGYEGYATHDTLHDLLIVNAGYEDRLTAEVAEDRDKARKLILLGLPSLKADMYQQGLLRTLRARDSLGEGVREFFAPASDPFATATVLSEMVSKEKKKHGISNLYLSPLSTKPSTLGFALYYLRECLDKPASILFPYSDTYSTVASSGIGKIWKYSIELGS